MALPLYNKHDAPEDRPKQGNAGLWYDKFCNQWCRNRKLSGKESWTLESFRERQGKDEVTVSPKAEWIGSVVNSGRVGNSEQLEEHRQRMAKLLEHHQQTPLLYKLESDFVTGLGREHPVENGFAWHHTLGTPYLPGSSVKGLVRAWAERWHCWAGKNEDEISAEEKDEVERLKKRELKRIFGSEDQKDKNFQVGSVIFLDAIPTAVVQLKTDVMTPHYGPWYRGEAPPADWHSPTPVPFLVVEKGATFLFGVMPRRGANTEDCERVRKWLDKALEWLGAGAKTAVGYGRFVLDTKAQQTFEQEREKRRAEQRAKQEEEHRQRELERKTKGKSELYTELYITSLSGGWREDKNAFSQAGLIEGWLDRLEADPKPDAIALMHELMQIHYGEVLADPDATEGRKQKPKFKDRQRNFAKRMLKLLESS